jgi:hypothetical protein
MNNPAFHKYVLIVAGRNPAQQRDTPDNAPATRQDPTTLERVMTLP